MTCPIHGVGALAQFTILTFTASCLLSPHPPPSLHVLALASLVSLWPHKVSRDLTPFLPDGSGMTGLPEETKTCTF